MSFFLYSTNTAREWKQKQETTICTRPLLFRGSWLVFRSFAGFHINPSPIHSSRGSLFHCVAADTDTHAFILLSRHGNLVWVWSLVATKNSRQFSHTSPLGEYVMLANVINNNFIFSQHFVTSRICYDSKCYQFHLFRSPSLEMEPLETVISASLYLWLYYIVFIHTFVIIIFILAYKCSDQA